MDEQETEGLLNALSCALENYPERVDRVPVEKLVLDSARQNERRPAFVKLAVPDDVVKALRGPADKRRDQLILVSIPQQAQERSASRIILPGDVG